MFLALPLGMAYMPNRVSASIELTCRTAVIHPPASCSELRACHRRSAICCSCSTCLLRIACVASAARTSRSGVDWLRRQTDGDAQCRSSRLRRTTRWPFPPASAYSVAHDSFCGRCEGGVDTHYVHRLFDDVADEPFHKMIQVNVSKARAGRSGSTSKQPRLDVVLCQFLLQQRVVVEKSDQPRDDWQLSRACRSGTVPARPESRT